MVFRLVQKSNSNCKTIWMILILLISICLIVNKLYELRNNEYFDNKQLSKPKSTYNLGTCSKNCCATQWRTPINITEQSKVLSTDIGKKFFTSNLTCNNGVINTGCVCLTPESKKLLENKGYVKQLPVSNGLLEADNLKSVWQLNDNLVNKPAVLGQTTELTGKPSNTQVLAGNDNIKNYNYGLIDYDIDINNSIPIDNNMIDWNNNIINANQVLTKPLQSNTEKLISNPLGKINKN